MACFSHWVFQLLLIHMMQCSSAAVDTNLNYSSSIRDLLLSSHQESLHIVTKALLHPRQRRSTLLSSVKAFTFQRQNEAETTEILQAAEIFHATLEVVKKKANQRFKRSATAQVTLTELLSMEDVELMAELSQCPAETHPDVCQQTFFNHYRSISGLCNNRKNPHWGAANIALVRWLPADYDEGERKPRGWNQERLHNGFQLPSSRKVSREILRSSSKPKDDVYSQLFVEWGQYIDHDITFTPQSTSSHALEKDMECLRTCEGEHTCFPIKVENPLTGAEGGLPFYRSAPHCVFTAGFDVAQALQRQQINAITSFIDASVVYGHTLRMQSSLRDLSGRNGKLAINDRFKDSKQRAYLPFVTTQPSACHQDQLGERVECFNAGDSRVNEGLPLITLHTMWLREHNRLAEALKHLNHHWTPEMIYQETRKIIGAMHQIVTMRDYVPKIIGVEFFKSYIGPYMGYDPTVDPSASNVFATAAFRFGHATISPVLRRLNESFWEDERFSNLRLHNTFFSPWRIVKEGGIDPVLRGTIGTAASAVSSNMLVSEEVTEKLVVLNTLQHLDLASLNLQRGRDHGLPGYNDWRVLCGLMPVKTLDDLTKVVGAKILAEKIVNLYKHLDNIDVWLGGLVEDVLPGSRTGPLFACLIARQMKALRDGDRFWWENEGMFTQQQKDQLVKFSLSRLICENSNIDKVLPDSFKHGTYPSDFVSCEDLPTMNLEPWKEKKGLDLEKCGCPGEIKYGDYILSSTSGELVALYTCYYGFQLKGSAVIECVNTQWTSKPPLCASTS